MRRLTLKLGQDGILRRTGSPPDVAPFKARIDNPPRLNKPPHTVLLVLALILTIGGCKRQRRAQAAPDEPITGLATVLNTADPRVAPQLLRGFHTIEGNAWRWTTGDFAAVLKPPAGADEKGATLVFRFAIPDTSMRQLQSVTLSASVNGKQLPPETYTAAGEHTYSRDVPAEALKRDTTTVEFTLDKYLHPNGAERRDLGVVASMIGFQAKP
jgi:hypothetical protein